MDKQILERNHAPTGVELPFGIRQNTPCAALFTPGVTCGEVMKEGLGLEGEGTGTDMQQRSAHENPVIFYSMAIGFLGKSTISSPISFSFSSILSRSISEDWWAIRYFTGFKGY